jgi:alkylation response protein AidB-like acyl-CoA dehydrogenase
MTRIVETVRHYGLAEDPLTRQELMRLWTNLRVASYTNQRAMDRIKSGQLPGPEMSIAKLALTQNLTGTAEFVARVLGPRLTADTGEWGTFAWAKFLCGTPGMRVAGGTDEVLRNIVGERVLGLPKEPGIDSVSPFRDLLKN